MYFTPKNIDKIVNQIKEDDIGIIPCDTVPGLVGKCTKACAHKLYELKGRDKKKPMLVMIPSLDHLKNLVSTITPIQQTLIHEHWPGLLTIIFEKSKHVPSEITGGKSTIAIRFPEYVPLNILLNKLNEPLISTSANMAGKNAPKRICEIDLQLKEKCDFYLDKFECLFQDESTIVDCSENRISIIRQGVLTL